ncbi:folate-binding protein [Candidatus Mesenet endosymbiont of Agriotes lineatus]|uniref:CAF17-like 4Fe-4S cluster assembly/insertion protein YgfZ n=1 Tax=Candidatus Mesenet endosymbiont of Agriotes lineatus TaxID=3077948 RepID=UPI0030CAC818
MSYIPLPNRGVILLQGPDTRSFLQGVITNDITKLQDKKAIYSLLLSPQGRYLYDFFLVQKGKNILLECEKAYLSEIIEKLSLLRTYLKVKVRDISERYKVGVILGGNEEIENVITFADPRHKLLGVRTISPVESEIEDIEVGNFEEYEQVRIQNLVPSGTQDMIQNKSFPLQFMIDKIGGIDFNKGCYIGQEVVARMHRIPFKKKIYSVTSKHKLLAAGAKVTNDKQQEIGELLSSINNIGIALLNVEEVNNTNALFINDVEVKIKN